MNHHKLIRKLALISAICVAVFGTSANAGLFDLQGSGSVGSFPNAVKLGGTLSCDLPNLGLYVDTETPHLILTDASALAGFIPNDHVDFYPATVANCTETINGVSVSGTGAFQQAVNKSGTLNAGGGNGPSAVPSGLVVTENSENGATTYTLRFYVDDRSQTEEKARYKITFQGGSICDDGNGGSFSPCEHKMGLPDPDIDSAETAVTKGGTVFPEVSTGNVSTSFGQYVIEELSLTVSNATLEVTSFSDFKARWLHNGSEDGNDPIVAEYTDSSGQGKPQKYKLRTAVETTLDIFVEFAVNPQVTVTGNPSGNTPTYVLSDDDFDATTITATSIKVDGSTVNCSNTTTTDINGDGKDDWKCSANTAEFVAAAGLTSCQATDQTWTSQFSVQVIFDGKERAARDLESTYPINCNI